MRPLRNLDDGELVEGGSVLRMYKVYRRDIMKFVEDRSNPDKQSKDYYELMIVDGNTLRDDVFMLINVTSINSNRGSVFGIIENVNTRGFIKAKILKQYFSNIDDLYLM